jgi:hypothetical protein
MRYHVCAILTVMSVFIASTLFAASDPVPGRNSQAPNNEISNLEKTVTEYRKELNSLKKEIDGLKKELKALDMPPVPDLISLCDKPIPLFDDEVREGFEREFYQLLQDKGLLTILVKRHAKFLAVVSAEIERAKMPPDLVFLAVTESYLNPRVRSVANAGGMWQFIKETGKREGLFINDDVDERYTVTRSTRIALAYLNKLNSEFSDWFLAMAAYNCGENRVRQAIASQCTRDFFGLFLPEETSRYIYRIAAIKEILSNPVKYGLRVERNTYYRPYAVEEMTIELDRETHTSVFAQIMQVPYKRFRMHNLQMRKDKLSPGIYRVYVPVEKVETFLANIKTCPGVYLQKEEQ